MLQGSACAISVFTDAGYCAERRAEVALQHVADIDQELLATAACRARTPACSARRPAGARLPRSPTPGKLGDDSVDRIARDEAGEKEVHEQGHDEDDQVPADLAHEISRQRPWWAASALLVAIASSRLAADAS